MTVYIDDPDFTLHHGDVRDVLRELPADSVDCAVTSPPFYALRDYGTGTWEGGDEGCDHLAPPGGGTKASGLANYDNGLNQTTIDAKVEQRRQQYREECRKCGARRVDRQIGLEATPDQWAAELVAVFREVRRVLRPSGTLWVECGDSYASNGVTASGGNRTETREDGMHGSFKVTTRSLRDVGEARAKQPRPDDCKPKDLIGAPWLLAFALRADGWYLRQCIVWHKPNAMPESAKDRCTTAHSYVFLLSKSARYWFDSEAIAEPAEWARWGDQTVAKDHPQTSAASWIKPKTRAELMNGKRSSCKPGQTTGNTLDGHSAKSDAGFPVNESGMKNARSVWTIPTSGYAEAHFATFPEALVERMLKAGCPEWVCARCGKARERVMETNNPSKWAASDEEQPLGWSNTHSKTSNPQSSASLHRQPGGVYSTAKFVGWSDCGCGAGFVPGTVLDPFGGSGTTALVARRLGRRSILVELNAEYCAMAAKRLGQLSLFA